METTISINALSSGKSAIQLCKTTDKLHNNLHSIGGYYVNQTASKPGMESIMFNPFDAAKARKAAKAAAIAADPKKIAENEVIDLISNHPDADLEPVENGLGFLQADIELEAQAEKAAKAEADEEKTELATYALAKAIYLRKQQMEKAKADAEARKLASKERKEAARKATNTLMQEYFTVDTEMDLDQAFAYVEYKTGLVLDTPNKTNPKTPAKGKGKGSNPPADNPPVNTGAAGKDGLPPIPQVPGATQVTNS